MKTDPIADMLTRIRNGQAAKHEQVSIPASKIKIAIAHILKQEGFVSSYRCIRDDRQGILRVILKYSSYGLRNGRSASKGSTVKKGGEAGVIREIRRISSPGCRRYVPCKEIPSVKNGFGMVILSTSQGIMTGKESSARGIGGELICSVY